VHPLRPRTRALVGFVAFGVFWGSWGARSKASAAFPPMFTRVFTPYPIGRSPSGEGRNRRAPTDGPRSAAANAARSHLLAGTERKAPSTEMGKTPQMDGFLTAEFGRLV
jgi:hypothetical protein